MLNDHLQDYAAVYVAGAMRAEQREQFELLLDFHQELRAFVAELSEICVTLTVPARAPGESLPAPGLKARVLGVVADLTQRSTAEGMVMCGPEGLVEWVNPAFTQMCGYTLDELRGKKLGPILQGAQTDRDAAMRMGQAVHACEPCREKILNYHKTGTPYWVEIAITPILDEAGAPLYFVARELELPDGVAA